MRHVRFFFFLSSCVKPLSVTLGPLGVGLISNYWHLKLHCNQSRPHCSCMALHQRKRLARWCCVVLLCRFLSLPPTSSSYHSSSSNHLLFTATVAVSLPSEPYGESLIWSRWMCAIQQSELQSGLKQRLLAARLALHSAVCELLNHGKVYTTSLLNSPLPFTAPLSTILSSNVNTSISNH